MPLSQELSIHKRYFAYAMILYLVSYVKVFAKPLVLFVSGGVLAFWDETILLQADQFFNIDILSPFAKGVSALMSIALTGLGGFYAHSKWGYTKAERYMAKVKFLKEEGFLSKNPDIDEIRRVIKDHFG